MESIENIKRHQALQKANVVRGFGVVEEDEFELEIFKAYENDIEKAKHNVGDVHPNGKWVWKEISPGKFDWRTLPKKKDGGTAGGNVASASTKDRIANIEKILKEKGDLFLSYMYDNYDDKDVTPEVAAAFDLILSGGDNKIYAKQFRLDDHMDDEYMDAKKLEWKRAGYKIIEVDDGTDSNFIVGLKARTETQPKTEPQKFEIKKPKIGKDTEVNIGGKIGKVTLSYIYDNKTDGHFLVQSGNKTIGRYRFTKDPQIIRTGMKQREKEAWNDLSNDLTRYYNNNK